MKSTRHESARGGLGEGMRNGEEVATARSGSLGIWDIGLEMGMIDGVRVRWAGDVGWVEVGATI